MPRRLRIAIFIAAAILAGLWAFSGRFSPWLERSAQPVSFGSFTLGYAFDVPPSYNQFADQRTFLGIPNFMDVASNLPFLFAGIWGLAILARRRAQFEFAAERWPYIVFSLAMLLTFFGSSYYHLHPDNARLLWDRLPITLGLMAILAAVLTERISVKVGLSGLPLLAIFGVLSVFYWSATATSQRIIDLRGAAIGDLRPYNFVQFGSLLLILAMLLLFRSRYTQQQWLLISLAAYPVAKVAEAFDRRIFAALGVISGHSLKHLIAAASAGCIVHMLARRKIASPQQAGQAAAMRA
jgi:hypothetical protein